MSWDQDFDCNEPWREGFATAAEERTAAELRATVYTTTGGRRFHADPKCVPLREGRTTASYLMAEAIGGDGITPLYPLAPRVPRVAVQRGFTACRVCVPPELALPATGETYGHEPLDEYAGTPEGDQGASRIVCARCVRWWRLALGGVRLGRRASWPCTSAAVLGLVVVDADRWNAHYPVGTPVTAYPDLRPGNPAYDPATSLHTVTRTPAWRLGHGDSVVSVDGYAGGIALTHVDPR